MANEIKHQAIHVHVHILERKGWAVTKLPILASSPGYSKLAFQCLFPWKAECCLVSHYHILLLCHSCKSGQWFVFAKCAESIISFSYINLNGFVSCIIWRLLFPGLLIQQVWTQRNRNVLIRWNKTTFCSLWRTLYLNVLQNVYSYLTPVWDIQINLCELEW